MSRSQQVPEFSDIAGQLMGRVSELTRVGCSPSAHLDPSPTPVSVNNEAVMVFHLEGEESGGADKDAVDVGDPAVIARWEIVIGGAFIAQS